MSVFDVWAFVRKSRKWLSIDDIRKETGWGKRPLTRKLASLNKSGLVERKKVRHRGKSMPNKIWYYMYRIIK